MRIGRMGSPAASVRASSTFPRGEGQAYPPTMFRIGAFAGLSGVSAKTLRAWDEARLFRPAWVDPATGYRWLLRRPAARAAAHRRPARHRRAARRDRPARRRRRGPGQRHRPSPRRPRARARAGRSPAARAAHRGRGRLRRRRPAGRGRARGDPSGRAPARRAEEPAFDALEAWVRDHGRRAGRPPGTLLDAEGRAGHVFVPIRGSLPAHEPDRRDPPAGGARRLDHPSRPVRAGWPAPGRRWTRWIAASGWQPSGTRIVRYLQFGADAALRVPPRLAGRPGGGPRDRAPAAGQLSGSTSSMRMRLLMRPLDS